MSSTDPKAVVIRYLQAARDGMPAVIRDSFAPDATGSIPVTCRRRAPTTASMRSSASSWPQPGTCSPR